MQVLVGLNGGGMIAILPECSLLTLSLVVLLGSATGDELHALGDDVCSSVFDQKMNVIGCHNVIEHTKSKALLGFEKPAEITAPIACKLKEKFSLMAAVRDVPNVSRQEIAVSSRHLR